MSAPAFRPLPTSAGLVGRAESPRNGCASDPSDSSDRKPQIPGGSEGRPLRDWLARLPPQCDAPEVVARRASWLAQAAADAFEALQAPDPELEAERAVIAAEVTTCACSEAGDRDA
jgi:hypothetical protein